jgi:hypothetical protein
MFTLRSRRTLPRPLVASGRDRGRVPGNRRLRQAVAAVLTFPVVYALLHVALPAYAVRHPGFADPWFGDRLEVLQARHAGEAAERPRVVIMTGSSVARDGFDGRTIENVYRAETGRASIAFNFGTPGAGPVSQLLWWKRLFAAGVNPDLAIIESTPTFLMKSSDRHPTEYLWGFPPERLRADEAGAAEQYGVPASCARDYQRGLWTNPWNTLRGPVLVRTGHFLLTGGELQSYRRITDRNGRPPSYGRTSAEEYREMKVKMLASQRQALSAGELDANATRALRDLLALCREHGTPAVLVRMPEGGDFRALYSPAVAEWLNLFLRQLADEFGATIVEARDWVPDELFVDDFHLLDSGAAIFSERFARQVLIPGAPSADAAQAR